MNIGSFGSVNFLGKNDGGRVIHFPHTGAETTKPSFKIETPASAADTFLPSTKRHPLASAYEPQSEIEVKDGKDGEILVVKDGKAFPLSNVLNEIFSRAEKEAYADALIEKAGDFAPDKKKLMGEETEELKSRLAALDEIEDEE